MKKDAPRVEAYGAVDELNAAIGVVLAVHPRPELAPPLAAIQAELFELGGELAAPAEGKGAYRGPRLEDEHVARLERTIDAWSQQLPPLRSFVLPGGTLAAAQLHIARTVCRRAERALVALHAQEPLRDVLLAYLNRLSDALFVLARAENAGAGGDVPWVPRG